MRLITVLTLLLLNSFGLPKQLVADQVTFTVTETPDNTTDPDASPWLQNYSSTILFETEAENVLLADEVNSLPGPNENGLGRETGTLHFFDADTQLGFSFSITADATVPFPNNPASGFTYNDTEGGDIFRTGALSPGDVDNFEDDDVTFRFLGGSEMYGFGFDLLDSNYSIGESVEVYDTKDNLLARFEMPPGPTDIINNFFIGISSQVPIGRITFLENDGPDDIAIRDFRFATQPPINISQEHFVISDDDRSLYRVTTDDRLITPVLVGAIPQGIDLIELVDIGDDRLLTLDRATEEALTISKQDASVIDTVLIDAAVFITQRGLSINSAGVIYGMFNGLELRTLDLATGETTLVAPVTGAARVEAIAFGSDDTLYAIGSSNDDSQSENLYTLDTTTGELTLRGAHGFADIDSLTFAPDGFLYGADAVSELDAELLRISPTDGQATSLGLTGVIGVNGISAGSSAARPSGGTLIEGAGEIGGVSATCRSDNVYWAAHGASLFFQISDPVVQFELTVTVPAGIGGSIISVDVEASKQNDLAILNLRALLFNFTTGSFVSLPGIMPLATTDAVHNFGLPAGSNPADFIEPGTREFRLLLETIQTSGLPNVRTQLDEVLFNFE